MRRAGLEYMEALRDSGDLALCHHYRYFLTYGLRDRFLGFCREEIAVIFWATYHDDYAKSDIQVYPIPPQGVKIRFVWTQPHFRGQNVFPRAMLQVFPLLAQEGITMCAARISVDNTASQRAFTKLGFARVTTAHYLRPFFVGPDAGVVWRTARGRVLDERTGRSRSKGSDA